MEACCDRRLAVALMLCVYFLSAGSIQGASALWHLRQRVGLSTGYQLVHGVYQLKMQEDCNLVLYHDGVGALWSTDTSGAGTKCYFVMQDDGNAVLYTGAKSFNQGPVAIWTTNTVGLNDGEHEIILQDDGNVVMYNAQGSPIWATDTAGR